ncbi:MAG: pilus assembly protein TadG-related protein [Frankiaceae bacterium]
MLSRTAAGRRCGRDHGSILLLTIGYALIAIALIVVVVDASAFFLSRRALSALADGAAVAGTHAEDGNEIYAAGTGTTVPLTDDGVRSEVDGYLAARETAAAYPHLQLADLGTDGTTVSVSLREDKPLPFLALIGDLTGAFPGGTARIDVTARARAPVTP